MVRETLEDPITINALQGTPGEQYLNTVLDTGAWFIL